MLYETDKCQLDLHTEQFDGRVRYIIIGKDFRTTLGEDTASCMQLFGVGISTSGPWAGDAASSQGFGVPY